MNINHFSYFFLLLIAIVVVLATSCIFTSAQLQEEKEIPLELEQQQREEQEAAARAKQNEIRERQILQDENVVIRRVVTSSDFDESQIEVVDQVHLPEFEALKEMSQFKKNGLRLLKFGSSHQSAVATKNRPPPPTYPQRVYPTNESFPLQPVDWSARPVFRYITTMSQAVPFYEIRAAKFNEKVDKDQSGIKKEKVPQTVEKVLLVGMGAGSVIKALEKMIPSNNDNDNNQQQQIFKRVDVIEIDPVVISLAEKYFDFKNSSTHNINILEGDAYDVLNNENNKRNDEMKYDLIITDCAASGKTHNEDISYPLRPKSVSHAPEISQPLACFKPKFLELLPEFYLREKEASVVVANFVGFIEPVNSMAQKPTLRVLKTFKTAFQRNVRPIVQPTFMRKWKDGFRPTVEGHRNAKNFDNLIIFATWGTSYEPTVQDMIQKIQKEITTEKHNNYKNSRYHKIADENLYLDLIRNRYERQMKEMEDEVVILPRTERKKPTIKVKELPDYYVPLKERDGDDKKKMKGSIWHEY